MEVVVTVRSVMVPRGGSRTHTPLRTTDFKSRETDITKSYQTIQASIYAPSGRQGIASAGFVSTRAATILAPSSFRFRNARTSRCH